MNHEDVALYEAPSLYDALIPPGPCEGFYTGLARRCGGPVLELACGTGRLSVPLAADGHRVVGLDISAAMLEAARRKAVAAGREIEFVEGDMRSFELLREFALVVVSCNSLSHLTTNGELVDALRCVARHLAPGGLLAFDVVNPRVSDLAQADGTDQPPRLWRTSDAVGEELLAYDPVGQVRFLRWRLAGEGRERRTSVMRLRTIFPQELPLLLNAAGLELAARFGDFDGGPLAGESLNQVCIACRCPDRLRQ
ncbi:class I SAM-dependent DNA methyltransferase [Enterovirga aerilata]|uniref:Class I SAM-dependent methyltransferase n=1 Tax=Enterovirga aerilata TaxID=2730920 RepID=A0A849ICQ6_9HYPH|nr:class I SAM-dependent methyltransferase [Enterovirga sp. DB1703]NNM75188.1 class I SAM-dependent methyltransferase [Enterovirga sp. DB1703]